MGDVINGGKSIEGIDWPVHFGGVGGEKVGGEGRWGNRMRVK